MNKFEVSCYGTANNHSYWYFCFDGGESIGTEVVSDIIFLKKNHELN